MTGRFLLGEVHALPCARVGLQKKKREQAPALNTELSTSVSIAGGREKSRKTLRTGQLNKSEKWQTFLFYTLRYFLGVATTVQERPQWGR
jgi:hypothetical protein